MTPNDVLRISEPIEKLYMDCSSQLLINLCRHFRDGKALASRDWEIKKLSELGQLTAESIEIIAANTGIAPEEIKNAVSEALRTELSGVENTLASAAKKGLISGPTASFEASENVRIVLQNLVDQAVKDSNVVNTVMLESVRNQYLFAISNTLTEEQAEIERMQSAANLQQLDEQLAATQQALNASTFSVASGSEARTTALRRTIKQLADQGITGYIDAGGHKWSPEAYINMDIRTTVHNAAVQGQKARSADYQVTTFLVSSHSGARPLCYPYQGKVFSWDGSEGTVYDLDGNPYHYESIYNTSYGEPAGLFGINCGHSPITFVDGYTVPRLDPPENEEENNRIYRESQQQRAIEREIRGAKTEALAYQAAGDEEGFQKAAQRVKKYNAEYKDFCKSTGRTERTDRTQVYGYNRSTAQKARWAAKDYTPTPKAPKTPAAPAKPATRVFKFTPADTIENAEKAISKIVDNNVFGAVGVSYVGVDLDVANKINNTLLELYDTYDVGPFGGIIAPAGNTKLGKMINSSTAAYSPVRHSFLLNRKSLSSVKAAEKAFAAERNAIQQLLEHPEKFDFSKLNSTTRKVVEHSAISGRATVPDTIEEVLMHEFGHAMERKVKSSALWDTAKNNIPMFADRISGYASADENEYIAESFASYRKGENVIDPVMRQIFEGLQR